MHDPLWIDLWEVGLDVIAFRNAKGLQNAAGYFINIYLYLNEKSIEIMIYIFANI